MNKILLALLLSLPIKTLAAVSDGQPVNAATTNAAFMDKNTTTTFTAAIANLQGGIETTVGNDTTTTGSSQNVTLVNPITVYANASLASIQNITLANRVAGSLIWIRNNTGGNLVLINKSGGTASLQIDTGTGANLTLPTGSAASLFYDTVASNWHVSGVSGLVTVPSGGTGQVTLTNHGVLVGAGTSAITQLTAGAAGSVMVGQGGSSDPTFTITPTLGVAGASTGTLSLAGVSSGTITIQPQSAAGTYNFNLPITAGTNTYLLTSAGGGSSAMTWTNPSSLSATPINNVLVNSALDYWQSGTSATVAATGAGSPTNTYLYQADQWYVNNILGGGTVEGIITYSRQAGVTNGSKYGAQVKITTAPTGTGIQNGTELWQTLSAAATSSLYNQTASFNVLVKALGNVNQVGCQFFYSTTEIKAATSIGSEQTATVNSSTFSSCTITAQALSTSMTTAGTVGVRIRITGVSSGNTYDVNNGFVIEQAMMNVGSTVGPFARQFNDPVHELASCQYFFEKSYDTTTAPATTTATSAMTFTAPATSSNYNLSFKITKRVSPTMTFYSPNSGATGKAYDTTTTADVNATAVTGGLNYESFTCAALSTATFQLHWVADARL